MSKKTILKFVLFFPLITNLAFSSSSEKNNLIGQDAPYWALKTLEGNFEFLDNYSVPAGQSLRGDKVDNDRKVVVLSFFATWCQPCVKEIGELHKLQKKYSKEQVAFFLVDLTEFFRNQTSESKYVKTLRAKEFLEKRGLDKISVLNDNRGIIAKKYGVSNVLPRLFIIDKYQKIVLDETGLCPSCFQDDVVNSIEIILNQ